MAPLAELKDKKSAVLPELHEMQNTRISQVEDITYDLEVLVNKLIIREPEKETMKVIEQTYTDDFVGAYSKQHDRMTKIMERLQEVSGRLHKIID